MTGILRTAVATVATVLVMMVGQPSTQGHQETERYIPIDRSPGISGKQSYIGTIQAYDPTQRTVTVKGEAEPVTVSITERTRIWLDLSKIKKSNRAGETSALQVGRRTEVKFENLDRRQFADWIKVEILQSE
ncbi:MAG: hypothetical protein OEU46_00080 [Alphaproteobacteria bacterium]|nr:hypothetical protein [Alphaproteobacteria bacterium]